MLLASRIALAGLAIAGLAACTPPAAKTADDTPAPATAFASVADADIETRNALLTALTPAIEDDLDMKVSFRPEIARTMGDWGWISGDVMTAEGAAIDFGKTAYAAAEKEGAFDGPRLNALLKRKDKAWTVVDFDIGSTDVAWTGWPAKHNAPPEVMGLEREGAP